MLYRLTLKTWQSGCNYPPITYTYCGETQEEVCMRLTEHAAVDPLLRHLLDCGELTQCWDCCEVCDVADPATPVPPTTPTAPTPETPWRRYEAVPAPNGGALRPLAPTTRRPRAEHARPRSLRPLVPTIY